MAIKIRRKSKAEAAPVPNYSDVPMSKAKPSYPKASDRMIENTFFKVSNSTGEVVHMVTVMPDGLRVAWGECGKCKDRITRCQCRNGFYHSAGIAFIRACYDHPDRQPNSFVDYSAYYDPWNRKAGGVYDRQEIVWNRSPAIAKTVSKPSEGPSRASKGAPRRVVKRSKPVDGGLTAKDIENIDMSKVAEAASKQAEDAIKSVRRVIRRKKV